MKTLIALLTLLLATTFTSAQKEKAMHASGSFDVRISPQNDNLDPQLSRFLLDKQYNGDLVGTGKGQMLAAGNPASGNGGYVAIEKVSGTLQGRIGSFILQHSGTMKDSVPAMSVSIVPGSGAGELEGISGTFTIKISSDGKHAYELDYTLPSH